MGAGARAGGGGGGVGARSPWWRQRATYTKEGSERAHRSPTFGRTAADYALDSSISASCLADALLIRIPHPNKYKMYTMPAR